MLYLTFNVIYWAAGGKVNGRRSLYEDDINIRVRLQLHLPSAGLGRGPWWGPHHSAHWGRGPPSYLLSLLAPHTPQRQSTQQTLSLSSLIFSGTGEPWLLSQSMILLLSIILLATTQYNIMLIYCILNYKQLSLFPKKSFLFSFSLLCEERDSKLWLLPFLLASKNNDSIVEKWIHLQLMTDYNNIMYFMNVNFNHYKLIDFMSMTCFSLVST